MTKVDSTIYAQFVECVEDVAIENSSSSNFDEIEAWKSLARSKSDGDVFHRVFKAVERFNLPQVASTDSLTSSLSRSSSNKNLSSEDLAACFTPEHFMEAVEALTMRDQFGSTGSLSSLDSETVQKSAAAIQGQSFDARSSIYFFFKALEEFINKSENDDEEANLDFPKFC
jgi:hypothetical protein